MCSRCSVPATGLANRRSHASRGHPLPTIVEASVQKGKKPDTLGVAELPPWSLGSFSYTPRTSSMLLGCERRLGVVSNESIEFQPCLYAFNNDFSGSLASRSLPASCLTFWMSLLMTQLCSSTECRCSARYLAKNRRALREPRIPHQVVFQVFFRTR